MSAVSLSEVTTHPDDRQQPDDGRARSSATVSASAVAVETAHRAQYSVWPRSSRNCSTEKTRMTANSTHAIAEAAPNWKKFWKAVS